MRTLHHIKVGSIPDGEPTSEALSAVCDDFMATGKTQWPVELFRIPEHPVIRITSAENLTDDELRDTAHLVNHVLRDNDGGIIVTRPSICISVTTRKDSNEQA